MTRQILLPALATVATLALSLPAWSHEFSLLLLAPTGASQAEIDEMRAAFLIAAHERDSHPDETSEGHLGGMDVQLTLATADSALADTTLAFVAAPFATADDARVAALAAPGDAVIVDADTLAVLPANAPEGNADAGPFANRFLAETGRAPGPAALGAYRAARVVDLAVRSLGSVDDRAELRRMLAP